MNGIIISFFLFYIYSFIFAEPMISAGGNFTVAVSEDGYVYAWGNNDYGQLGDGTNISSNVPVKVKGIGGVGYLSNIKYVSAGGNFTVAVSEDGYVYAWGNNDYGQLGDGTFNTSYVPVKVKGVGGIGYLSGIKMVSAGYTHVIALKEDGTVYVWGTLQYTHPHEGWTSGLLGGIPEGAPLISYERYNVGQSSYPIQVMTEELHIDPERGPYFEYKPLKNVKLIACSFFHSVALKEDGTVLCWGVDVGDQCGLGNTSALVYPYPHELVNTYIYNPYTRRNEILTDVRYISAGDCFTVAIKNDDFLWFWGENSFRVYSDYADGYARPSNVGNILTVDSGPTYFILLSKDQTVKFWGNANYNIGIPYFGKTPIQIPNLSGLISVSAGGGLGVSPIGHVVCLKADGSIWGFGENGCGQLGNGKTNWYELEPQKVLGLNGTGYLNLFNICVIPNPFNFPTTPIGCKNLMTFFVKNISERPITIGKIFIEGEYKNEFSIERDFVSFATLKPKEAKSFKIIFHPIKIGSKTIRVIIPYGNKKRELYINGVCGTVENKVVIKGTVYDKKTGNPIENANILIGYYSTITNENGFYMIDWASPGIYNYAVSKEGYVSSYGTIELTSASVINKNFYLIPSTTGEKIEITEINTKYNLPLYFLGKVSFPVEFSVSVDWKNYTPYKAIFKTTKSNKIYEWEASQSNPYLPKITIDIGELEPGDILRVKAISGEGSASEEKEFIFVIMKPLIGDFKVIDIGSYFYYQVPYFLEGFSFINEGIESDLIPTEIPFFGGSSINLLFTPVLKAEVINNTAEYSLLYKDLIKGGNIGPVEINFSPHFGLSGVYSSYLMKWQWNGFIGLLTDMKSETPPFYLPIPIPIPIYVKGAFLLSLDTRLNILNIKPVELSGNFVVEPAVRGIFGVGISDVLSAEGWVQAGAEISMQYPHQPNLQQILIVVKCGYTVYFIIGEYEAGLCEWQWKLYGDKRNPEYKKIISDEKWKLIPRDYLINENYGIFNSGKKKEISKKTIEDKNYTFLKAILQENVFPLPQPKLISRGNNLYLVYLYDNPERSSINRTVLVFTSYNGNQWSSPVYIYDDGTLDFHPDLVVFDNGDAICTWENIKEILSDNFPIQNIPEKMEITVARYNSSINKWERIQNLTNDNYYDRTPLVRGELNDLFCIWIKNKGNSFIASQNYPDEIYYSKWNGENWTSPEKINEFKIPVLKMDFIYKNGYGYIVLNCDTDSNLQTIEDREIYLIKYENGIWKEPIKLTDDNEVDDNPKLVLTHDNKLKLFWIKKNGIFECEEFNVENKRLIRKENYSSQIADFKVTSSENGKIAIIWTEPSGYTSDIYSILYNQDFDIWSEKINLTEDEEVEKYVSPTYFNEDLSIIYLKQRYKTKEIPTKSNIPNLKSFMMPSLIKSEISFLQFIEGIDISVENIIITPENALPGDIIFLETKIVNKGEKPLSNFDIVFYINDNEVLRTKFEDIINTGEEKILLNEFIIPTIGFPFSLKVVVDPENKL
ncbi:MAG: carboxypeptidase regulatory-like domain-containing protein, partial [bacterium]|nr:carboxypeptidase regulatory-like domain-containing protein [bacterium]MDW8163543.1 carboxypeptidase regulatory-like domain-containing protein [Candidatus Omnitrophota bacterium]